MGCGSKNSINNLYYNLHYKGLIDKSNLTIAKGMETQFNEFMNEVNSNINNEEIIPKDLISDLKFGLFPNIKDNYIIESDIYDRILVNNSFLNLVNLYRNVDVKAVRDSVRNTRYNLKVGSNGFEISYQSNKLEDYQNNSTINQLYEALRKRDKIPRKGSVARQIKDAFNGNSYNLEYNNAKKAIIITPSLHSVDPHMVFNAVEKSFKLREHISSDISFLETKLDKINSDIITLQEELKKDFASKGILDVFFNGYDVTPHSSSDLEFDSDNYHIMEALTEADINRYKIKQELEYVTLQNDLHEEQIERNTRTSFAPVYNQNNLKPFQDNFIETINFYKEQLQTAEKTSVYIEANLKSAVNQEEKDNYKDKLIKLEANIIRYNNIINQMGKKNHIFLLRSLGEEVDILEKALESGEIVENLIQKIDFLNYMLTGQTKTSSINSNLPSLDLQDNEDKQEYLESIRKKLNELNKSYVEYLEKQSKSIFSNDIHVKEHNIDFELAKAVGKDIDSFFSLNFLGITENMSGKSGLIPQVVKSLVDTYKLEQETLPRNMKNNLLEKAKKIGNNFDWLFDKSESGIETGNIIGLWSDTFQDKFQFEFKTLDVKNKDSNIRDKVRLSWLKANTDLIDIRKLKVFKDIYGSSPDTEIYFNFSDSEMDQYEQELKDTLGYLYEDTIKEILEKTQLYFDSLNSLIANSDLSEEDEVKLRIAENPFLLIRNFYSRNPQTKLSTKTTNSEFNVSLNYNTNNIFILPKKELNSSVDDFGNVTYKKSGYINEEFLEHIKDKDKYEYWKALKDLYSNYINPIYGNSNLDAMSYGKIEEDLMETIVNSKGLGKLTASLDKIGSSILKNFYGKSAEGIDNKIYKNYADGAKMASRELREAYSKLSNEELDKLAQEKGINFAPYITRRAKIRDLANHKALKGYSKDLNRITITLTDLASFHSARQQVLPLAETLFNYYKTLKHTTQSNPEGVERVNAIRKLEAYIDTVIKNIPDTIVSNEFTEEKENKVAKQLEEKLSIPDKGRWNKIKRFSKGKNLGIIPKKYLNKIDKEILQIYEDLYKDGSNKENINFQFGDSTYIRFLNKKANGGKGQLEYYLEDSNGRRQELSADQFDEAFRHHVLFRIHSTGIPANLSTVVTGIQKFLIFKSLGLSPFNGITNRLEGKETNYRMDATGRYWTKGNMEVADHFLSFITVALNADKIGVSLPLEKINQMKIFKELVKEMDIIQDRKAEVDKNITTSRQEYKEYLNPFSWAVDIPEFKNQGAILLSVLMDSTIENNKGEKVPFFDKKTMKFTAYEIKNGKLQLKPEFNIDKNRKSWGEFSISKNEGDTNEFALARARAKHAIARSQGNYDSTDMMLITGSTFGKALMTFKRWMPEHFMQRFNFNNEDFDLFTNKQKQSGRFIQGAKSPGVLIGSGLLATAGFIGPAVTALGTAGAVVGAGLATYAVTSYLYNRFNPNNTNKIAKEGAILAEFLKSALATTINYPLYQLHMPPQYRVNADFNTKITGITEEQAGAYLAIVRELVGVLYYLGYSALAAYLLWDDEDDEKKHEFYFINNQINKLTKSATVWVHPQDVMTDASRMSILSWVSNVSNLTYNIMSKEEATPLDKYLKVSPVPNFVGDLLSFKDPMEDDKDFNPGQKWVNFAKDYANDGYRLKKNKLKEDKYEMKKALLEKELKDIYGIEFSDVFNDSGQLDSEKVNELTDKNGEKLTKGQKDKLNRMNKKANKIIKKRYPEREDGESELDWYNRIKVSKGFNEEDLGN